jgi:predicted transposase YbfD/YdcC
VLCGADTWVDVAEWAEDNESWLKKYLKLLHGTPSHGTFSWVFRILEARAFEAGFRCWIAGIVGAVDGVIAIDGKTALGPRDEENSPLHTISAYATASGLTLGQGGTRGKGNKITAIQSLLNTFYLKGCIVTIDAIGCQKEIACKITERGGDYLLAVKDNQKHLAESLREFFVEGKARGFGSLPMSTFTTVEKDPGRIETRTALWVTKLTWLDEPIRAQWPKLAGVGMIEHTREINGQRTTEQVFYIGSRGIADAQTLAKAARSHWTIENGLHWVLDVILREDDCRVRKVHAPQNFSALRKLALAGCAPIRLTPNGSLAPDAKLPSACPITAPYCSNSSRMGKCDCPGVLL